MREVSRVEIGGAKGGDARRRTRRYDDVVLSGAAAGGQTRSAFSWRRAGAFVFMLRALRMTRGLFTRLLGFAHRLPCRIHDRDVLRMQLRRHVLADGFLHVLDAHPIAQRRQRAEEHRVRNRSAQNGRRDAVGIERRDALVVEHTHAVHQHDATGLQLGFPALAQQRIVEVDHVVGLRHGAAVADGLVRQLRERPHRRAAPLGPERRKRQSMPTVVERCRRAQQPRSREGALAAATVPQYFDHGLSPSHLCTLVMQVYRCARARTASRSPTCRQTPPIGQSASRPSRFPSLSSSAKPCWTQKTSHDDFGG